MVVGNLPTMATLCFCGCVLFGGVVFGLGIYVFWTKVRYIMRTDRYI